MRGQAQGKENARRRMYQRPAQHLHPTGPLHSLRSLCALRHGMFHIGKDRVDLDFFAAFLTQPDTVKFAHDGITIDTRAPFTRESWLFTHQITSYRTWTFLPLALRLTMHSARFELTLALRQEVPKPSCFQVTPDLFHWQGHLLDDVRVTLSFGIGCLVVGKRRRHRPLLRVSATKLRASASWESARKLDGDKEGGRTSNSNSLDSVGDGAVRREALRTGVDNLNDCLDFFFALCCLGKIPGGAPFSPLHKSGNGSRVDRP